MSRTKGSGEWPSYACGRVSRYRPGCVDQSTGIIVSPGPAASPEHPAEGRAARSVALAELVDVAGTVVVEATGGCVDDELDVEVAAARGVAVVAGAASGDEQPTASTMPIAVRTAF